MTQAPEPDSRQGEETAARESVAVRTLQDLGVALRTEHDTGCATIVPTVRHAIALIDAALAAPSPAEETADLLAAAEAVIDRWDTPLWKDVPPTADCINRLRAAVVAAKAASPAVPATQGADAAEKRADAYKVVAERAINIVEVDGAGQTNPVSRESYRRTVAEMRAALSPTDETGRAATQGAALTKGEESLMPLSQCKTTPCRKCDCVKDKSNGGPYDDAEDIGC